MPLLGKLFGFGTPEREPKPYFKKWQKYNKLDVKKATKRFERYNDQKRFKAVMAEVDLPTGKTVYGKEILEKSYAKYGHEIKRKVKDTLTDKPDTAQADQIKARNLLRARLDRAREAEQSRSPLAQHDYHHVETALTHDHAHTSIADLGSTHSATPADDNTHHSSIPLNHGL
jgi:hypothetical protein